MSSLVDGRAKNMLCVSFILKCVMRQAKKSVESAHLVPKFELVNQIWCNKNSILNLFKLPEIAMRYFLFWLYGDNNPFAQCE